MAKRTKRKNTRRRISKKNKTKRKMNKRSRINRKMRGGARLNPDGPDPRIVEQVRLQETEPVAPEPAPAESVEPSPSTFNKSPIFVI